MPRRVKKQDEILSHPINVAVLGSGGREHALAVKISESPFCAGVHVLPGNAGMSWATPNVKTQSVDLSDSDALVEILRELETELVVIGPDDLLASGLGEDLTKAGFPVFGPGKAASKIEWSKAFAKEIMRQADVPTARHEELTADDDSERLNAVAQELGGYPIVLKYDGLALGKGVRICADENDARDFMEEVFEARKFARGAVKGKKTKDLVVAEEFLQGHEVSLFAITDGKSYALLEPACDYKRLLDGNVGPNTGGMGAYSPVPWLAREQLEEMGKIIFPPVLAQMNEQGAPFKGLLYAGLMVRGRDFWVLEFNARFGDPETQVLLPRMQSDLLPLLWGVATGTFDRNLAAYPLRWNEKSAVNVVVASGGYPEAPQTGFPIQGMENAKSKARLYCAGVKSEGGTLLNGGGRVFSVTCLGEGLNEAADQALSAISEVRFEGMQFRKDIGRVASNY